MRCSRWATVYMLKVTRCCLECCVPSGINFEAVFSPVVCHSIHCKLWHGHSFMLNLKIPQKSTRLSPSLTHLQRCSTNGHSFAAIKSTVEALAVVCNHTSSIFGHPLLKVVQNIYCDDTLITFILFLSDEGDHSITKMLQSQVLFLPDCDHSITKMLQSQVLFLPDGDHSIIETLQ